VIYLMMLQVEKEVQKAISLMDAVDVEINKKKEVSRKVGPCASSSVWSKAWSKNLLPTTSH
jgi:hypothetical protein